MSELILVIKDKGNPRSIGEVSTHLVHKKPIDFSNFARFAYAAHVGRYYGKVFR